MTSAGAPKSVWFGVACGVAASAVAVIAVLGAKAILFPGPKTFVQTCSHAKTSGTISFPADSSQILVQVSVDDPQERKWTVRWGDYDEEVGPMRLSKLSDTTLLGAAQTLGDIDDGTQRTAQLRPDGEQNWCQLKMHILPIW